MFAHISVPTVANYAKPFRNLLYANFAHGYNFQVGKYAKLFRKLLYTHLPYTCTLVYVFITFTEFYSVRKISDISIGCIKGSKQFEKWLYLKMY